VTSGVETRTRFFRAPSDQAGEQLELPRGDLAAILYEASRDHAEFVFDENCSNTYGPPTTSSSTPSARYAWTAGRTAG
jgi:hypothetical protein